MVYRVLSLGFKENYIIFKVHLVSYSTHLLGVVKDHQNSTFSIRKNCFQRDQKQFIQLKVSLSASRGDRERETDRSRSGGGNTKILILQKLGASEPSASRWPQNTQEENVRLQNEADGGGRCHLLLVFTSHDLQQFPYFSLQLAHL